MSSRSAELGFDVELIIASIWFSFIIIVMRILNKMVCGCNEKRWWIGVLVEILQKNFCNFYMDRIILNFVIFFVVYLFMNKPRMDFIKKMGGFYGPISSN